MKFWIVTNTAGETLGCETTKAAAIRTGLYSTTKEDLELRWVDVDVNAETIRLLLAGNGGYANAVGRVTVPKTTGAQP
jgi:hypothetical protein